LSASATRSPSRRRRRPIFRRSRVRCLNIGFSTDSSADCGRGRAGLEPSRSYWESLRQMVFKALRGKGLGSYREEACRYAVASDSSIQPRTPRQTLMWVLDGVPSLWYTLPDVRVIILGLGKESNMRSAGVGLGTAIWWGSIAIAAVVIFPGIFMLGNGNRGGIGVIILGVLALGAGYHLSHQLPRDPGNE
jgi:hypothetical protein